MANSSNYEKNMIGLPVEENDEEEEVNIEANIPADTELELVEIVD